MKKLKLFIWEGVLEDYTSGIMFAIAENVEEARELIMSKSLETDGSTSITLISDLKSEPKVIESKEGFYIWGVG